MRTVGSHRAKRGLGVAKRSRHPASLAIENTRAFVRVFSIIKTGRMRTVGSTGRRNERI